MVRIEKDAFKSFEVYGANDEILRIDVNMPVKFIVKDTGEVVNGLLSDIVGKGEKAAIKIKPYNANGKSEIWDLDVMAEGSLCVDEERI
jgi:hypothetical protein